MKKFLICALVSMLTAFLTPVVASSVSHDLLDKPIVVEKVYQGGSITADVLDLSYLEVPTLFISTQNNYLTTADLLTLCPVPTEGKVVYKGHRKLNIRTINYTKLVRNRYPKPVIFNYPETSVCKGYKGNSTLRRC